MIHRDAIGDRSEHIFDVAISKLHGDRPFFRPVLLGGKWPLVDAAVEQEGEPGMFFLAQVKTTTQQYTRDGSRMPISADVEKLRALAAAPVPSYRVGVHEPGERVLSCQQRRPQQVGRGH